MKQIGIKKERRFVCPSCGDPRGYFGTIYSGIAGICQGGEGKHTVCDFKWLREYDSLYFHDVAVPVYEDEMTTLRHHLEIATRALESYANMADYWHTARAALDAMK